MPTNNFLGLTDNEKKILKHFFVHFFVTLYLNEIIDGQKFRLN